MKLIALKKQDEAGLPVIDLFVAEDSFNTDDTSHLFDHFLGSINHSHFSVMDGLGYHSGSIQSMIVFAKEILEYEIPSAFRLVEMSD
jgi:hypothetical protein